MRSISLIAALALVLGTIRCWPQQRPDLHTYLKDHIGLSDDQIQALRGGQAITKALRSRAPGEIFVFGAIYIGATPDAYVRLSTDFERLRQLPGYLAIARFSTPPQLADLKGFTFEDDDIEALKECEPGHCEVQMPESSMKSIRQSIDFSAPDAAEQMNRMLQETAVRRLNSYQQDGNVALGIYNDKEHPTDVARQIRYILSYSKALPEYLPEFYNYLLSYPRQKPPNVEDSFYWAKVKFGLKPTLRIVHVVTMRGATGDPAYAIAEKQLYASHYFQTALDLTFCIAGKSDSGQQADFYLIKIMGSEQAGLTGVKGSIVRKAAVDRSTSTLKKSLESLKAALEQGPRKAL